MAISKCKHLIVFVKNAELGKVKTRLAATVGNEKALDVYRQLLQMTASTASQVSAQCHVFYSEGLPQASDVWSAVKHHVHVQADGDLGVRMWEAFRLVFSKNKGEQKVIIIGSDSPELHVSLLEQAFRLFDSADYVLGPTFDGGYYLLGMKSPSPAVFEDMAWSTDTVCEESQKRIFKQGKSLAMLSKLNDVDNEADFMTLRRFFI